MKKWDTFRQACASGSRNLEYSVAYGLQFLLFNYKLHGVGISVFHRSLWVYNVQASFSWQALEALCYKEAVHHCISGQLGISNFSAQRVPFEQNRARAVNYLTVT